jgi:hypothetical protein
VTVLPRAASDVRHVPQRAPVTALVLLFAAVVLLGLTLAASDRPTAAVVWGGLALAAYAAGLLMLFRSGPAQDLGLARWKFGPWILLWWGATFGIATMTWSQPQSGIAAEIAVPSVLRALWLVAVGLTVWAVGYRVGPGRLARNAGHRAVAALQQRFTAEIRSCAAPWILYAIGSAARIATALTTGLVGYTGDVSSAVSTATGYGQILTALGLCAPLAVSAAALQVYRERLPGARVTLAVLLMAEIGFGAVAGQKENFVIAVLAVAIPFCVARRRVPRAALLALIAVFFIVVIPFNQAYRDAARNGSETLTPGQAAAAAPGILGQTLASNSYGAVVSGSTIYLLQRLREIDNPAIVVQRTPQQLPFASPMQLIEAPVVDVVPRAIWPGKPILATGYQFSQEYYGLSSTVYTSSAITPIGDLYRHGGWIPVIIGMALLGCGARFLDDVFDVRSNTHAIFLALLLFPSLVGGEGDWITLLASLPATVLVWLFAVGVTFRKRQVT